MEVDLTGPSPVKKLKQPRLSFGPVKKDGEENSKKRKLSNEENTPNKKGKPEDNSETKVESTPLRSANIVNKSPVKSKPELSSKTKSILSSFASKDRTEENDKTEVVENKDNKNSKEKVEKRKNSREIKPKKKTKLEDKEDEIEEKDTSEKKPGSIKMPWSGKKGKGKKSVSQEVVNIDDNSADFFEMNDNDIEDDVVISDEKEVEEEHEEDEEDDEELDDELAWLKKDNDEENTPVSLSPRKKRGRKSTSAPEEDKEAEKAKSETPAKDEAKPKTPSSQRRKSIKTTTPKMTKEEKEEKAKKKSEEKAEKDKQRVEEKERKEKEKKEEKDRKEKEKADEKEAKERRKSVAKEEKEKEKAEAKLEKEKLEIEEKEKEKAKAPVPIKESPLFKFLVKSKPGAIPSKPAQAAAAADDDIEVLEVVPGQAKTDAPTDPEPEKEKTEKSGGDNSEAPSTPVRASPRKNAASTPKVGELGATEELKTPVRSSPRKKTGMTPTIASMFKTPKGPVTPKLGTPKAATTPIAGNQEESIKVSIAKIRVEIISLNDDIDKAVADKDFLKAHELKLKITGLEEEIKKIEDGSPSTPGLPSIKQVSPKTPVSVKTSGSTTPGRSPGSTEKKMTPKQIAYREELRKKREEKEREKEKEKEEKKKVQDQLKAEKEKEKQEKERQKEIDKRVKEVEKLEKEREKEKERKEKEAQKELEKKQKEEEKAKKKAELEEAKLLKQKEKEEEKKKAEEAEKEKLAKKAQAFKGFFVKKDVQEVEKKAETEEICQMEEGGNFTPFRLKRDSRMAPLVRNDPVLAKMRIDSLESPSGPSGLYLEILKSGNYQPKNGQSRTWPLEAKNLQEVDDDDIEILNDDEEESEVDEDDEAEKVIEEKPIQKSYKRAKLFQFHENQRPAYWGTWTQKHEKIKGRTPFARDEVLFDYDYDSDEDWEEEEQGESLSDDEKDDKEEEDDYEVDNKFFVPHGYLSDEEEDKDEDEVFNPDTAKEKLKLKEEEFAAEQKKKTKAIKPHIWGCHWEEEEVDTSAAAAQLIKILSPYSCIIIGNNNDSPIDTSFTKTSSPEGEVKDEEGRGRGRPVGGKRCFPEEAMVDLIKLIHANPNSKVFLTKEFVEFWKKTSGGDPDVSINIEGGQGTPATPLGGSRGVVGTPATPVGCPISKKCIVEKIVEVADYKKMEELGDKSGRFWVVKPEILEKYKVTPSFPNDWNYILEPPKQNVTQEEGGVSRPDSPTGGAKNQPPNPASLITKFTKILTEEERAKNLAKPATPPAPVVAAPEVKEVKEVQGIGKFAVKLTEEEHKKKLATPIDVKKTPGSAKVTPIAVKKTPGSAKQAETSSAKKKAGGIEKFMGAKASPISVKKTPTSKTATPTGEAATTTGDNITPKAKAIAIKKTPGSKSTPQVNQIATKKTPGSKPATPTGKPTPQSLLPPISTTPKANPIATKKTPKAGTPKSCSTSKAGTPKSGATPKGGRRISLTAVRSSPRKKSEVEPMEVECIDID